MQARLDVWPLLLPNALVHVTWSISDPNPYRLELAARMGATLAIDPTKISPKEAMLKAGMREGYDVGLEMSGNPIAFRQLFDAMNHGGRVALLGFSGKHSNQVERCDFQRSRD